MNSSESELASQLITLLAAGMLVIQLLMVVQRMLLTSIRLFALQSLMLAGIAAIVAFFHDNAIHVYWVAGLTLIGKVFFLPWRHLEVSRAWTSVALTASRAEQAQRERVFQP